MDKTRTGFDRNEVDLLLFDDNTCTSNDESPNLNNLNFPWPLINLIKKPKELYQEKPKFIKYLLYSYHFQLLVVFIISIICVQFGPTLKVLCCSNHPMISIYFVVQGSCGLFIVLAHMCSVIFRWTPSMIVRLSFEQRCAIQNFMAFTHLVTVFSIIWFFIGHVWFIKQIRNSYKWSYYEEDKRTLAFTMIMLIVQYVVGIWLLYCWIQNNPQHACWFKKKIVHQTNNNIKPADRKEITVNEKAVDRNINVLIHI